MKHHPCILIVDDTDDVRELYAEYFSFVGFSPVEASNGREAIEQADRHHPAAIIMDLAMPILDGWEATRILKGDSRFKDVPIIVLTGNAMPEHIRAARDAGADAVLRKPCTPDQLTSAIKHALNGEPIPTNVCNR